MIDPGRTRKVLLLDHRTRRSGVQCVIVLIVMILTLCTMTIAQDSVEKLREGNRARDAGLLSEAEMIYRSLLDDPAVDEAARGALAQVLSWQGKYDEAIEQYQELRKRYPQRSLDADVGTARCYAWSGRFRQAVDVAERGLADDPDNPDLLLLLGQVESWAGHTKRSIAAFDRLLERDPGNRKALLGRGRALSWSGSFVEAERQFREILSEDPDDVEARVALVHNLIWMGRFKDAREVYEGINEEERDRRDVRIAKVALSRILGDRAEFRHDLGSLREEYPGETDVKRFSRLEVDEVGPHLRTRAVYVRDSDELEIIRYVLGGAFPLSPSTYLFFDGMRGDLSYPRVQDATAGSALIGIDTAVMKGIILRIWGGSRFAEDADNEVIGGARVMFKTLSNTRIAVGYEESFADYTPQAVRNNTRQRTADLNLIFPATQRLTITGDLEVRKYKSDLFSQRRDFIETSFRWALPGQARLRTDVGIRSSYFRFDEGNLDTGYYNPSDFRQVLGFVTFTQRFQERTRLVLDLAYGTKKVAERGWESTGTGSLILFAPIGEKVDLTGRIEYSRISIVTGNYATRALSLGLLFRLR